MFGDHRRVFLILMGCAAMFLNSCAGPERVSTGDTCAPSLAGDWQGGGVDSDGNEFTFAARVIALGENRYRMRVLDRLDSQKEPMHVMDGELIGNQFPYTADEGLYTGSGMLDGDTFEGYYKGPVGGTFIMHRVKESQ